MIEVGWALLKSALLFPNLSTSGHAIGHTADRMQIQVTKGTSEHIFHHYSLPLRTQGRKSYITGALIVVRGED